MEEIKKKLIAAGVKNMREFGYLNVNEENILTDEVYCMFFQSMLKENLGNGQKIDDAINEILSNPTPNNK